MKAKALAGYSATTTSAQIERSFIYKTAKNTVESQRRTLQSLPELSMSSQVLRYNKLSNNIKHNVGDRIKAMSKVDALLGYESPKQVQVDSRSLIVELSGSTSQDLALLRDVLTEER